jgi:glycerol-3-phosphate O-acyltransferase
MSTGRYPTCAALAIRGRKPAMRKEDQERILTELRSRVVQDLRATSKLDEALADSVYHEARRMKDAPDDRARRDDQKFWAGVKKKMNRANDRVLMDLLGDTVDRYGNEIAGHFDERVYGAVTRAGEPLLGLLLNAVSPKRIVTSFPELPGIDEALIVQGEVERLRRLHELGTVILVPTHVSHMDSIAVGWALWKLGLPPFLYGAGLNLFSNPLLGFFLRNLGAYTVDRRKQDPLYKHVLKEYATLTLEHGFDNIFFPGGTRSRAGAIEKKLKLGLLGTGVAAYVNNLRRGKTQPKIFIVPATLSFQLVLEAETLVDDFLKEVGKSRYIITDDEFSKPKKVFDFVRQLFSHDSKIYFTVGKALDPFGNYVDDNGDSIDPHGRVIDTARYVMVDGEPQLVDQRDAEYTREVGEALVDAYAKDTVIQSTHVTARAVFTLLRKANPGVDLVRLLRAGGRQDDLELRDVYKEADRLLSELRGLASRGGVRLSPMTAAAQPDDVIGDGLMHFALFHSRAAATRRGDRVFATDRALLFYYQNRLEGYRLERNVTLAPALSPDHRALGRAA